MNNISILDCTLRDGGYINDWNFGEKSIKKVISKLSDSDIDIIECGFIRDGDFDRDRSLFNGIREIKPYLQPKNENIMYVGMIDQPYISLNKISDYDGSSIDGIRLTFHGSEEEINEALYYGKKLMDKGYKVFIQPVGVTSYSDEKLLKLINRVNNLNPYAFYLVDTLGVMYKNDLLRLFHLLDNNLNSSIRIGFHSHNNLQLSFSNAQELLMLHTKRNIIIDSTVFGMGRGAGNLCTELITHYINENIKDKYNTVSLLEIVDEELSRFFTVPQWGYSIPYYIAAANNCHPNYASFLMNKQTISVKKIDSILKQLPVSKRDIFDESYIEDLYINHQINLVDDTDSIETLRKLILGRPILLLAPGKSIDTQNEKINSFIEEYNPYIFSVNFIPDNLRVDALFISNLKRFESIRDVINEKAEITDLITTSNITNGNEFSSLVINYSDLLINNPVISDNAGLMLINLLNKLSVETIYLAGFDGFSLDKDINYYSTKMINNVEQEELIKKNKEISKHLANISRSINMQFVTKTVYN